MAFDAKAFMQTQFALRTARVAVPELAGWFADGDTPEWEVRQQTANEMAKVNAAPNTQKDISTVIKAVAGTPDKVKEMQKALGIDDGNHEDLIRRMEILVICSVDPVIKLDEVVKLGINYPMVFWRLTNKIGELTLQGADIKKSKPSGKTQKSEG